MVDFKKVNVSIGARAAGKEEFDALVEMAQALATDAGDYQDAYFKAYLVEIHERLTELLREKKLIAEKEIPDGALVIKPMSKARASEFTDQQINMGIHAQRCWGDVPPSYFKFLVDSGSEILSYSLTDVGKSILRRAD